MTTSAADEVVAREAVLAHQPSDPPAEREAADPGGSRRDRLSLRDRMPAFRGRRLPTRLRRRPLRGEPRDRRARSFMGDRSITMPPSHVENPATLWPPPRTAMARSLLRAKPIAAVTSAAPVHRTMSAGRRPSCAPFQMRARVRVPLVVGGQDLSPYRLPQFLNRCFPEDRGDGLAHDLSSFRLGLPDRCIRRAFARS